MARRYLPMLSFALAGCLDLTDIRISDPPPGPPVEECSADGLCVTAANPVAFSAADRFGAGTVLTVGYHVHSSVAGDVEIVAADPTLLVPLDVAATTIGVHAARAGTSALIARRITTQQELARHDVTAVSIAAVSFTFRTTAATGGPITQLAALAAHFDTVGVAYVAADGEELAGTGALAVTGAAATVRPGASTGPLSEAFEPRTRVGIDFHAAGATAQLVSTLDDGRRDVLAIEIVSTAATIETAAVVLRDGVPVAAPPTLQAVEPVAVDILGRTADGRFVAGVGAAWTSSVPVDVVVGSGVSQELIFTMPAGAVDITGTVAGRAATSHLVSQ